MPEVAQGGQEARVHRASCEGVRVPSSFKEVRECAGQYWKIDEQGPPHVGARVVLKHLKKLIQQARPGVHIALIRVLTSLDANTSEATQPQDSLCAYHGLLVANALQKARSQSLEQVIVDGVQRVDDLRDQLGRPVSHELVLCRKQG